MFDILLDAIAEQDDLETPEEKAQYLQELQAPARRLWEGYRTQNVQVDYTDPQVQYAYMLRYFPFYAELLPCVLSETLSQVHKFPHCELANAAFFGCGPAPEVIGFLRFLTEHRPDTKKAICTLVDSAPHQWSHARRINRDAIVPKYWDEGLFMPIKVRGCIMDAATFHTVDSVLVRCHLVVFQNCLNEIPKDKHEDLKVNIQYVFSQIPIGSWLVFIDRSGYENTIKFLDDLKRWSQSSDEADLINDFEDEMPCELDRVPEIITQNLFNSYEEGRILARSVKYVAVIFQKSARQNSNNQ